MPKLSDFAVVTPGLADKLTIIQSGTNKDATIADVLGLRTAIAGTTGDFTDAITSSASGIAASFTGTGAILLPAGTTAERPDTGNAAEVRYNSTTGLFEFGAGGLWTNFLRTTGGTLTGALIINSGGGGNQITISPGATGATGATISSSGSGGLVLAGSPQTNNFQVGRQNNFAWSGSALLTALMPLFSTSSLSGSSTNNFVAANYLVVNGDTLAYSGSNTVEGLRVSHNFGGTGTTGARTGITALLTQIAANSDGAPGNIGVWSDVVTSFNNGGTGTTYAGSWWGFNSISQLNTGATFQSQLIGYEADIIVKTGASVADRVGIVVLSSSAADLVQGTLTDAAYVVAQNPLNSYPGWTNGFQFGGHGWAFPIDATNGSVISIAPQVDWTVTPSAGFKKIQAKRGIDLALLETSDYAFGAPGFRVDSSGSMLVANGKLSANGSGLVLDIPLQKVTAVAVNGGASGLACFVDDRLYDANGGIYRITSVNGSNQATGVSILFPGVSASPPANPVSLTGQNARSVSINLTWSASVNTLSLNPSGGATLVGGTLAATSYKVSTNQVVGARVTGWGAASNGAKTAFNGSTATLAQTSAAVAQLIADITTHGLIGA